MVAPMLTAPWYSLSPMAMAWADGKRPSFCAPGHHTATSQGETQQLPSPVAACLHAGAPRTASLAPAGAGRLAPSHAHRQRGPRTDTHAQAGTPHPRRVQALVSAKVIAHADPRRQHQRGHAALRPCALRPDSAAAARASCTCAYPPPGRCRRSRWLHTAADIAHTTAGRHHPSAALRPRAAPRFRTAWRALR